MQRVINAPDGGEQTVIAAWKQAIGCTVRDIANGTGLSSRTVEKMLYGHQVGGGSMALMHIYTGVAVETIKAREKRAAWTMEINTRTNKVAHNGA